MFASAMDDKKFGSSRQPLDPALHHPDGRPPGAVRAHPLPVGELGAGHREGRGRAELAPGAAGCRGAEPRQVPRLPTGGPHGVPRLRADPAGRPPRGRGPTSAVGLCRAGRVAGNLRRCPAQTRGRGHLPVPGRKPILVLHPAQRHKPRGGASGGVRAGAREGGPGGRAACAGGRAGAFRVIQPDPRLSAIWPRRARRPRRPARGDRHRPAAHEGAGEPSPHIREGSARVARERAPGVQEHAGVSGRRPGPPAGPGRGGATLPRVGLYPRRPGTAGPHPAPGAAGGAAEGSERCHGARATPGDIPVVARAGAV